MVGRLSSVMPLHLALLASLGLALPSTAASASQPRLDQEHASTAASVGDEDEDEDEDGEDDELGFEIRIDFRITRNGKTIEHPGVEMRTGEELGFSLVQQLGKKKKKHAIVLYVEQGPENVGYKAELKYSLNGKQLVKGDATVQAQAWTQFKSADGKTIVAFQVVDGTKKAETVNVPDGDDPLAGVDEESPKEPDAPAPTPPKKIEMPDGNDPLDGI